MGLFDNQPGPGGTPFSPSYLQNNPTENIFARNNSIDTHQGLQDYLAQLSGQAPPAQPGTVDHMFGQPNGWLDQQQQNQGQNQQQQLTLGQQLMQMLTSGLKAGMPQMQTPEQIRQQAQTQAGLQFDPQIAAINAEMSRAKTQTGQNTKQIGSLYNNLANSYGADVATSKANNASAKQVEADALKQLQGQMANTTQTSNDQQKAELSKLGLQNILPSTTANQQADMQFLSNLNNTGSAAQQRALDLQGQADQSFYNQGRGIAQTEGAEGITNLTNQLGQYLNQQGAQSTALQANKTAAIQSLISQMTQGQNDAMSKFNTTSWDNALKLLQQYDAQQKNNPNGQNAMKGILGAINMLHNTPGTSGFQPLYDQFNQLTQQPDFRQGQFQGAGGTMYKMTPDQAAYEARSWAKGQGLSDADTLALVNAIYAKYGALQ